MEVPVRWAQRMLIGRFTVILALVPAILPHAATAQESHDATLVFDRYMSPSQ